jgi:hypothetical protein
MGNNFELEKVKVSTSGIFYYTYTIVNRGGKIYLDPEYKTYTIETLESLNNMPASIIQKMKMYQREIDINKILEDV